jgi:uncharacterized protein with NAD-binding domain and iron-sulfur cluster
MGQPGERTKIAIVGGGVAGLAAAFELSRPRPDPKSDAERYLEHSDRYEITVYQMGWRLGGKGTSGRNKGKADRLEEHGLHVWMGFYENAFRLLRACYAELSDRSAHPEKYRTSDGAPHSPQPSRPCFPKWTDAFVPDHHVGVACEQEDGTWESWTAWFPPTEDMPGDPLDDDHNPFTLVSYLVRAAGLLRTLMLSVMSEAGNPDPARGKRSGLDAALDQGSLEFSKLSPRLIVDSITRLLRVGALTTAAGLLQAVLIFETILKNRNSLPGGDLKVLEFLDAIAANTRRQLEDVVKIDPRLRRKTELIDLVMTCIVGVLRDDLLAKPNGLDAIDHLDAREWLEKHGATRSSLESPIVRALYDMAFADVPVGREKRGRLSAGQGLRCALRMFYTYRGALFWRMRSSMGEVVFAPLFQLLKARGVKFKFFHRLEGVTIDRSDKNHPYVSELDFDRQAVVVRGEDEYEPLVTVRAGEAPYGDVVGWPSRPCYSQLVPGPDPEQDFESFWDRRRVERVTKTAKDNDFHIVILSVGLGMIRYLKGNLLQDRRWKDMVDNVKTMATQAFQIWLNKDLAELGWTEPPVTLSGFAKPFDTWSDMSNVIPAENWPKGSVRAAAYFCGALPELEAFSTDPRSWKRGDAPDAKGTAIKNRWDDEIRRNVRHAAVDFLNTQIQHLWSGSMSTPVRSREQVDRSRGRRRVVDGPPTFRWDLLVNGDDPAGRSGDERAFDSQFYTASLHPSDRYVLSVPGSAVYRISPLDDTYANLVVAGDWTACGFIGGCVEAAVMSGRLAAHAISGRPGLDEIIGYDHP